MSFFFFLFTFSSPNWLSQKYYRHVVVHQVLIGLSLKMRETLYFFTTKHNVLHMFWIIGHLLQPCLRTILLYLKFWRHEGIIHVVEKDHYPISYIRKSQKGTSLDIWEVRGCLVYIFKQQFSVFKQHFTHFNALFHPHVFP